MIDRDTFDREAEPSLMTADVGPGIVFSPGYDITFLGFERLHPFDSRRAGRAMRLIRERIGHDQVGAHLLSPGDDADAAFLREVHPPDYLDSLGTSEAMAAALEMPIVSRLPAALVDWRVLKPMRRAVRGTVLAARIAMERGVGVNMFGGFHHAAPAKGGGFCVYADVAVALAHLRREGLLGREDTVAYIDLDAHQGNGVARCVWNDPTVRILDVYNPRNFPRDAEAAERIDAKIELAAGTGDDAYLSALRDALPGFLDAARPRLVVYNAGTDIHEDDLLGTFRVTASGVLERDRIVFEEAQRRGLPFVMVPSGGYSDVSHRLLAETVVWLIGRR